MKSVHKIIRDILAEKKKEAIENFEIFNIRDINKQIEIIAYIYTKEPQPQIPKEDANNLIAIFQELAELPGANKEIINLAILKIKKQIRPKINLY